MNKKVIEAIAKVLKLDVEELTKDIATEEDVEFKLPEGLKVFTEEEYNTTVNSIKDNHGKTRYDAGKLAGNEMLFKDLSAKAGIDNIKDIDGFISSYKASVLEDAKIEPDKKIQELQDSLLKVQNLVTEKDAKISEIESGYKAKETKLKAQSYFPELPETVGLNKNEASNLFFMTHEIKEDGVYKNGELLKDSLEKPVLLQDAISGYVTEKGWDKNPAGRGGGAGAGGGSSNGLPKSMAEYEAHLTAKGINVGSEEANSLLKDMAKANPQSLN